MGKGGFGSCVWQEERGNESSTCSRPALSQCFGQFSGDSFGRHGFYARSGNEDDVLTGRGDLVFVQSKPFPQSPLDAIPQDGAPESLLHHHAETVVEEVVGAPIDGEVSRPNPSPRSFCLLVVFGRPHPLTGSIPMVAHPLGPLQMAKSGVSTIPVMRLRAQPLAPSGSTPLNHLFPSLGGHAH